MNKIILLFTFLSFAFINAGANDRCEIFINKKLIFKGEVEQENAIAFLNAKAYKTTDCITIKYFSEQVSSGWTRTFYFSTSDEKDLKIVEMPKQNGSVTVKASVFREMTKNRQPILIYTISLPADKALASRIRVRRMLVCKLEWK